MPPKIPIASELLEKLSWRLLRTNLKPTISEILFTRNKRYEKVKIR
jgi:hypothetical protein